MFPASRPVMLCIVATLQQEGHNDGPKLNHQLALAPWLIAAIQSATQSAIFVTNSSLAESFGWWRSSLNSLLTLLPKYLNGSFTMATTQPHPPTRIGTMNHCRTPEQKVGYRRCLISIPRSNWVLTDVTNHLIQQQVINAAVATDDDPFQYNARSAPLLATVPLHTRET